MLKRLLLIFFCSFSLSANASEGTILILGDSLSAGYGISIKRGWANLLQERLIQQGYNYRVINASISGDTTRGAKTRVDELLNAIHPNIAIIELGGNDGLRGLALEEMSENLSIIIKRLKEIETQILLIPMQLPPNYGPVYNAKFQEVYQNLASTHGVTLGRFILSDIADKAELMQNDGIHPKAEAQNMMLENIWKDIEEIVKD